MLSYTFVPTKIDKFTFTCHVETLRATSLQRIFQSDASSHCAQNRKIVNPIANSCWGYPNTFRSKFY